MTDDELGRCLAADLDRAYPRLLERHQHAVYGAVLRWSGHRTDAEELTQDTFVRAYEALRGYAPERVTAMRFRPWLLTIALNLFRNEQRRRSRRPATRSLDGVGEPGGPDD